MQRRILPMLAILGLAACQGPGHVSPDSPVGQGRAALEAGEYALARDAFLEGRQADPSDANAFLGLGAAYEGLGQLDSARAIYGALARANPTSNVRHLLDDRLEYLAHLELAQAAQEAVG